MEKNPINALISEIKGISKENYTSDLYLGIVKSGFPNLTVQTHNIIIDKDNILIDKWLVDRHEELEDYTKGEHTHGVCGEGGGAGSGEHIHKSKTYVDKLKAGDKVVMLRVEDTFCIISKVVGL